MEQKIYSRAATKSSLSDLVIDQANPERCFTKREMDLLRKEDTWVSCECTVLACVFLTQMYHFLTFSNPF